MLYVVLGKLATVKSHAFMICSQTRLALEERGIRTFSDRVGSETSSKNSSNPMVMRHIFRDSRSLRGPDAFARTEALTSRPSRRGRRPHGISGSVFDSS